MRVIGLTGGIACGKSTVSGALRQQPDCRIIDGDLLSRELTAPGGAALPAIREAFGSGVFLSDGTLNRRELGKRVFSDSRARARLDELMAPFLDKLTDQRIRQAREDGVTLCFLDYPLLFEKGYDRLCDSVWCVYLPRNLQLSRLMERNGITREDALARMNAVLSSDEKAARSTVVIDNSGTIDYTLSLLPGLLDAEREKAASPRRRRSRRSENGSAENEIPALPAQPGAAEIGYRRMRMHESGAEPMETAPAPAQPGAAEAGYRRSLGNEPQVMDRPEAARKNSSHRKSSWVLPAWLMISLITAAFLLLCGITAQSLMSAYLTRQAEKHRAEQQAIWDNYPMVYQDMLEKYAAEYNLHPAFVASIVRNESSFDPKAESNVGARGLMQLMPDTADWIAGKLKINGFSFERMWDPESNVRFGCWYLNYLSRLFRGDPVCVTCAYHAGQGQVTSWLSDPLISDDGITLPLSRLADGPTKTYAGRVIRSYGIYKALYYEADGDSAPDDADDPLSV